jgi:hypothetical protein
MRNLVRDITENCPGCQCSTEDTIKYLINHGDIVPTAEYYREIWYFYLEALKMQDPKSKLKKKTARDLTLSHFKISFGTFRRIKEKLIS